MVCVHVAAGTHSPR